MTSSVSLYDSSPVSLGLHLVVCLSMTRSVSVYDDMYALFHV